MFAGDFAFIQTRPRNGAERRESSTPAIPLQAVAELVKKRAKSSGAALTEGSLMGRARSEARKGAVASL